MRRTLFTSAIGVLVYFVFSISLSGQQTTVTSSQGLLYLQRSLSQLVGDTPISDVTLKGSVRRIAGSDDDSGTSTLKAVSSGSSRIDITLPFGELSEVRVASTSSGVVGSWSGPDGVAHAISYYNLLTDPGLFPAFTFGGLAGSSNAVVTFVGQEARNDASVLHVSAYRQPQQSNPSDAPMMQHLSQIEIFLDPTTLFPTALAYNIHPDDNGLLDIPVEIRFSDYRSVSSAQVPFHVQKFINNTLTLDLQFTSAATNTGLSSSDFSVQ
jgi:hypothetical protein